MYTFFIILIVIVSLLLTLLVLVQNSKGGGLAAGFTSSNQIMGVRKTTDFLEKATWTLVIALVVFSIAAVGFRTHVSGDHESEIKDVYQEAQQTEPGVVNPGFTEEAGAEQEQGQQGQQEKE